MTVANMILARVCIAFWVSECWATLYERDAHSRSPRLRRRAIHARVRAAVVHDRVLAGEFEDANV